MTPKASTPVPTAWVIGVDTNYPGSWLIVVACPYCGGRHQHGSNTLDDLGTRVAHCHPNRADDAYTLQATSPAHAAQLADQTRGRCRSLTKAGEPCRRRPRNQLGIPLCAWHQVANNLPEELHYQGVQ